MYGVPRTPARAKAKEHGRKKADVNGPNSGARNGPGCNAGSASVELDHAHDLDADRDFVRHRVTLNGVGLGRTPNATSMLLLRAYTKLRTALGLTESLGLEDDHRLEDTGDGKAE